MVLPSSFAVSLRGVRKTYANGVNALEHLNLDVWPGEFVSLLGPSGCGKSTALRIIAGLSEPSGGAVEWPRPDMAGHGAGDIGFVFQEPTLMPWTTVAGNVRLPLDLQRLAPTTTTSRLAAAADLLRLEALCGRASDALAAASAAGGER